MKRSRVLVTGGAGYIGSHTCKLLAHSGFDPVTYDNMSTGHRRAVRWGPLVEGDILDAEALAGCLKEFRPVAVLHFAASASVAESMADPAKYYLNNVVGTLNLLEACVKAGVPHIVFSSSCATYGVPAHSQITESTTQQPINPYGASKLIGELMLRRLAAASDIRHVTLRYFNACGADPSGELGEWHDPETHLIPRALLAAARRVPSFELFGTDYDTPDGTCIRDFIHVSDLAQAHLLALRHLLNGGGSLALNVGVGNGFSVREIVEAVAELAGRDFPVVTKARRPGDPPILVADAAAIRTVLGFRARFSDLDTILQTAAPFFGLSLRPSARAAAVA